MTGAMARTTAVRKATNFFLFGPPVILMGFAQALTGIVLTDLIVYRTCLVSLNINYTECIMLCTNSGSPEAMDLEAKVEPHASMIIMAKSLLESILPAVISLFLGSWSDGGGRRPLLLAGFSGFVLMFFSLSLMCEWRSSPWYLLGASVLVIIVGGIHLYFRLPETVEGASKESIRGLFKTSLVTKLVSSSFAKRSGFNRPVVWLGIPIIALFVTISEGQNNMGFLFTRARLDWDVSQYSYAYAVGMALRITGLSILLPLAPLMGASDQLLAGLGLLTAVGGAMARSLTWKSWHMYLAADSTTDTACANVFSRYGLHNPYLLLTNGDSHLLRMLQEIERATVEKLSQIAQIAHQLHSQSRDELSGSTCTETVSQITRL